MRKTWLFLVCLTGCGDTREGSPAATPVDIHVHATAAGAPAVGVRPVLLSLQHFGVSVALGEADPAVLEQNQQMRELAAGHPGGRYLASLPCWHTTMFADPSWVETCKADVDDQLSRGASGFKDHASKQHSEGGAAEELWLGAWNRWNGNCSFPATPVLTAFERNTQCMQQIGARYPLLEPGWRELVRYVVSEKQRPMVSHLADAFVQNGPQCHDPISDTQKDCVLLQREHLEDFRLFAVATLAATERRRIILAHAGFLAGPPNGLDPLLTSWLDSGLSVDTAALLGGLQKAAANPATGCEIRRFFSQYADLILFGTDADLAAGCHDQQVAVWLALLEGSFGEATTHEFCGKQLTVYGLDLDETTVASCPGAIDENVAARVLRQNADALMRSQLSTGF